MILALAVTNAVVAILGAGDCLVGEAADTGKITTGVQTDITFNVAERENLSIDYARGGGGGGGAFPQNVPFWRTSFKVESSETPMPASTSTNFAVETPSSNN